MNKKIIITGNNNFGLAKSLYKLYPDAYFASRSTNYDFTKKEDVIKICELSLNYDIFINNSALHNNYQALLFKEIFHYNKEKKHNLHIINIGSTIDRYNKGGSKWYAVEKLVLRQASDLFSKLSVWGDKKEYYPKVNYISFGSLSNVQDKHPDRKCLDINKAAKYIKWIIDQPKDICIHELSIDPIQYT